jgi:2-dehydropantoate 2-reductase
VRITFLGSGGVGGYFGGRLAASGADVVFVARGEHLRAIREGGLVVETPDGDLVVSPAEATDDPAEVGPVDAVILGVKAWQVTDAARAMRPMIGPETVVMPLQNGVEAHEQLAAVLGGTCGTISYVVAPGRIRSIGGTNFVRFGELDDRPSERTERLRRAFDAAGVRAEIPPDIRVAIWEKFLFVVSFGGLGAVTRAPLGVLRTMPETRPMLEACMREIFAVGRARGVALADGTVERAAAFLDTLAETATTSLHRDIADGKPSELEAWNGAVVRLGRALGISTPANQAIYAALRVVQPVT